MDTNCLYRSQLPLENPCIVQNVLEYLPHGDLKKGRLVSKIFNDEAMRLLRKNSKIVLNSPKRLIAFYLERFESVDRFCECFQLINVHVATPSMKIFLEGFGSKVKSLDLRDSKWSCQELETILLDIMNNLEDLGIHGAIPKDATRLFSIKNRTNHNNQRPGNQVTTTPTSSQISPQLPKIKHLDLQLFAKATEEESLQRFTSDLLSSTTNLEVLSSRDTGKWRSRRERYHRILFELLIESETVKLKLPKLRKIGFPITPWDDCQFSRLQSKNFPLTYLNLTILPNISTQIMTSLLISLRPTLIKLKISFSHWRHVHFPRTLGLHKLQHLSLDWFNGSLDFISSLPNLQTLILAQVNLNAVFTSEEVSKFSTEEDSKGSGSRRLGRFEVYQHSGANVLPQTVQFIGQVFPRILSLTLGRLDDLSLSAVFETFPQLEEFSAIEGAYGDSGLTGLDPKTSSYLIDQTRRPHNITSLKNLRKLMLKSHKPTDFSVATSLILCGRLKHLSLSCSELSSWSLTKLVDGLSLDYLETTHVINGYWEVAYYALTKMQGRRLILNGIVAPTLAGMILAGPGYSAECRNFIEEFMELRSTAGVSALAALASQKRLQAIYEDSISRILNHLNPE